MTAATTLDDEAQTVVTPTNAGGASGDVSPDTNTTSGAAGSLFTAGADGFKSVAMTSATFSVVIKDANGFALTETATWARPWWAPMAPPPGRRQARITAQPRFWSLVRTVRTR